MAGRDNFSVATKALIAQRAGYICSHPVCDHHTIGPSGDRKSGVTMTGIACHIVAAAKTGPRADPKLTPGYKSSEANGIWMCAVHAKWIDDNPSIATIATLQEWKAAHEAEIGARQQFGHPGIFGSWDRLAALSADQRATIETQLPNGYTVVRDDTELLTALEANRVCLVSGDSGVGKSALVKSALDAKFPEARQIWLGPDALRAALSEASREQLGLTAPLADLLAISTAAHNILVLDAVERADSGTIARLVQLLRHLSEARREAGPRWQIIAIGQRAGFEAHLDPLTAVLNGNVIAVSAVGADEVRKALSNIPSLAQHAQDDSFVTIVGNLRTLAWIVSAAPLFAGAETGRMAARSQIADRLWSHWTGGDPDLHSFMTALARRDAEYERSFALSDLSPSERAAWKSGGSRLPMALSERNRLSFEHDLASDWARYQYLKEIADDVPRWAELARQPLWVAALRLFGQYLLREPEQARRGWDWAFAATTAVDAADAVDVLLDALCLDPDADIHMSARSELLFAADAKLLGRLLTRFMHIATVPELPRENADLGLYIEAEMRRPVWAAWPPLIRFLDRHGIRLAALGSASIAKVCHVWLTKTPPELEGRPVIGRSALAHLALDTARTEQVRSIAYDFHGGRSDDSDDIFTAGLAGAHELPGEVSAFALEMVRRKPLQAESAARVAALREKTLRARADARASRRDKEPEPVAPQSILEPKRLPPWPLGPGGRLHDGFRRAILHGSALAPLTKVAPAKAAEVLLASIIEDEPREDISVYSIDRRLGLEWEHDDRPTIFWNSPFFPFLIDATDAALEALLQLVEFCTERWSEGHGEAASSIKLTWRDGSEARYIGGARVLDWSHTRESTNSQLYAGLDALERWLWMKIASGVPIDALCALLLARSRSVAILGVLCDCAKFDPRLLSGVLAPLLTSPDLITWDEQRLGNRYGNDMFTWSRAGERLRTVGLEWEEAEHRRTSLRRVIVGCRRSDPDFDRQAARAFAAWPPVSEDENLQRRLAIARLDPVNWRDETADDGALSETFEYPEDIAAEIRAMQGEAPAAPNLPAILGALEQYLRDDLNDETASDLFEALDDDEAFSGFLPGDRKILETAIAATLIIRGRAWLANRPADAARLGDLVERALPAPSDTANQAEGPGERGPDMVWACLAAVHARAAGWEPAERWDRIVTRGIATGEIGIVRTVTTAAYGLRTSLGGVYHSMIETVVFAAALNALTPQMEGEPGSLSNIARWRRRLALRSLSNAASPLDFDLGSLAKRVERIWRSRYIRATGKSLTPKGRRNLHRRYSLGIASELLRAAFDWALVENLVPSPEQAHDHRRAIRMLWDFVDWRLRGDPYEPVEERDGLDRLDDFGLTIIRTIAARVPLASANDSRMLWEPVLALGPRGEFTVEHMIACLFLRLYKNVDGACFISNWDAMLEYVSAPGWIESGKWWRGRKILRHMLGINAANQIENNPVVMAHVPTLASYYEAFAAQHIAHDDSEFSAFVYFFAAAAGSALRLRAIGWIEKALDTRSTRLRSNMGSALADLARILLADHAAELIADRAALQSLNNVISRMVRDQTPYALALQDRARALR